MFYITIWVVWFVACIYIYIYCTLLFANLQTYTTLHTSLLVYSYLTTYSLRSAMHELSLLLKLPSLFAAWLFGTFHTTSHNMKALVILSHSESPFLPLICLYGNKWTFVGLYATFWSIFLRKNSSQITHANYMTMTTSGQI